MNDNISSKWKKETVELLKKNKPTSKVKLSLFLHHLYTLHIHATFRLHYHKVKGQITYGNICAACNDKWYPVSTVLYLKAFYQCWVSALTQEAGDVKVILI